MTATITPIAGYRYSSSPARWQRALRRALEQGVDVRQLATSGVWVASSGTDATAAYVVTPDDCECRAAAEGDRVCKHRALLRHILGDLPLDPEPPTPAAPAAPARPSCPICFDVGAFAIIVGPGGRAEWVACSCTTGAALAAPDPLDDTVSLTAVRCRECDGRTSIADLSPDSGAWVDIACPACAGIGRVPDRDPDDSAVPDAA
jgi:hypothetical protein